MKIKAILASLLSAVALSGATAGEWCPPAKDTGKCPVDCCSDPLGFTFDSGYDSAYYFRGLWFSDNNLWSSLTYTKEICDAWSFAVGAYYTRSQDTFWLGGNLDYSELDVFTSLTYDAGFARFGLGFTHFQFFDTFSGSVNGLTNGTFGRDSQIRDASEVSLTMTIPLGDNANIYALYANDVRIGGQYAEVGADYTIAVSDCLSIIPSVQVGYNVDNYYTYFPNLAGATESGWNHIRPMITAPYKITNCVTLVPYVAANISLDARELINGPFPGPGEKEVYGGAKLSITF